MTRVVVASLGFAFIGCTSSTTVTPDAGPACDQVCVDDDVGVAIVDLVNGLYNQSVAGKPSGNQSVSAPCPLGGTATLTGTASTASNGVSSLALSYVLVGCQVNASNAQLTVDGTLSETGTFDVVENWSMNYASTALTLTGVAGGSPTTDSSCVTHVEYDTSSTPQITGNVCGRSF